MKFGRKIAACALPCLLMLAIALTPIGCGGSMTTTSGMSTTSTAASTATPSPSTTVSSQTQAAEAYFTAMAPTIEKDYQGEPVDLCGRRAMGTEIRETACIPVSRLGLQCFRHSSKRLPKSRRFCKATKPITSPPAFKTAHAALLANNEGGIAAFKAFIAAIKAKRPASELMAMLQADAFAHEC